MVVEPVGPVVTFKELPMEISMKSFKVSIFISFGLIWFVVVVMVAAVVVIGSFLEWPLEVSKEEAADEDVGSLKEAAIAAVESKEVGAVEINKVLDPFKSI